MKTTQKAVVEAGSGLLISGLLDQFVGGIANPVAKAGLGLAIAKKYPYASAIWIGSAVLNGVKRAVGTRLPAKLQMALPGETGGGAFEFKGMSGMGNDYYASASYANPYALESTLSGGVGMLPMDTENLESLLS